MMGTNVQVAIARVSLATGKLILTAYHVNTL